MLNLLGRDFKATIINAFKELKETMYHELKEMMKIISHQIEIINKTYKF